MKKTTTIKTLMAATLLAVAAANANAASWRINSATTKKPHFADINAAMASSDVVAGDTLYLDPGCLLTSTQNVTKRVTIVGTGYFLTGTPHLAASVTGAVYMKAEGSKMEGVEIAAKLYIAANNVTIERCKLRGVTYSGSNAQYAIIRQCYCDLNSNSTDRILGAGTASTTSAYWTIENCIIFKSNDTDPIRYLLAPVIRNNYICEGYSSNSATVAYVTNAIIQNNILINTKFMTDGGAPYTASGCVVTNNVWHAESQTYPDNIVIGTNTEDAVFALQGTNDQRYTLKEGSPAIGAATDGGDCGPTGGLYPYVPSGFPLGMPHFQTSSISSRPQSGEVKLTQQVSIQNQ